jgi:hypothetical protein
MLPSLVKNSHHIVKGVGCRYSRTPTLCCSKCSSITVKMSLKGADLRAPKRAIFVAGVFLVAARWLLAGSAGESPYGIGETGEAGAGTDVLEECLIPWPLKGSVCSWR